MRVRDMSKHSKWIVVPQGFAPSGEHADRLARLANELLIWTCMTEERQEFGHWIDVPSAHWRSMFGANRYASVLAEAEACGLIERRQSYAVGRFPKAIRLTTRYRSGGHSLYELTRPARSRAADKCTSEVERTLLDRMRLVELGEVPECSAWTATQIALIWRGQLRATRCQYGRLHTSYGSLPKRVRSRLVAVDGQKLTSIDVKNCQPLLLGHYAQQAPTTRHTTMCTTIPGCGGVGEYLDLCARGEVYEFIVDRLRGRDVVVDPRSVTAKLRGRKVPKSLRGREVTWVENPATWNRDKVKRNVQVCVFADVPTMEQTPVYQVIRQYWPGVAEYLVWRKSEGRYQGVAEDCQRLESRLMIDGVAMAFAKRFPGVPLVTIHDELMVPTELAGVAKSMIEDAFRDAVGVVPTVRCGE